MSFTPFDPANPGAVPTVSGNTITVDDWVGEPTRIPATIGALVESNQGYFANRIFAMPGWTPQGGAIIFSDQFPEDYFLDPDRDLAPRAPGAEAPLIGAKRRPLKVAYPESLSGRLEVHDEARRRNNVIQVQQTFVAAANTFADRMQTRALAVLDSFVTAASRTIVGTDWSAAGVSAGLVDVDPRTLPARDLALARSQFIADKAGVMPNLLVLNEDDAFQLDTIYGERLPALLARYGLEILVSPQKAVGSADLVAGGQVGVIAFEKPLDQELVREGKRKTDSYVLEMVPVFVANNASAVLRITGI